MRRLRSEQGLTLVELMLSMALMGVLVSALTLMLTTTTHWGSQVQEDAVVQTEVRTAIDRLARDLRQVYTGDGTSPIVSMSSSALTFESPDVSTPFRLRRIAYQLTGSTLGRAQATSTNAGNPPWTFPPLGASVPQVASVVNPAIFRFYDLNGVATTDPLAVHTVKISVTVTTGASQGKRSTYDATVALRQTR
jgi:prepilin-type N-terminal cleavage/methylation domain-containing protein